MIHYPICHSESAFAQTPARGRFGSTPRDPRESVNPTNPETLPKIDHLEEIHYFRFWCRTTGWDCLNAIKKGFERFFFPEVVSMVFNGFQRSFNGKGGRFREGGREKV